MHDVLAFDRSQALLRCAALMESGERASVLARAAFSLVIAARSATAVAQKAWMYKLAGAVLLDALERPADAAACFAAMAGQTPREAYGWALRFDSLGGCL